MSKCPEETATSCFGRANHSELGGSLAVNKPCRMAAATFTPLTCKVLFEIGDLSFDLCLKSLVPLMLRYGRIEFLIGLEFLSEILC